jgi:hypothetical protein
MRWPCSWAAISRRLSQFQQSATSEGGFDAAEKAGCSIGGGSTAVVSISSPLLSTG